MAENEPMGGVPLRMYLDLRQNHVADLVAVSQASIAFANGVNEIAYLLDPTLTLQIGLTPSSPGSLWQNTILRAQQEYERRKTLYQLAVASMIWFVQPPMERVRENLWNPYLDKYLPELSPTDRAEASQQVGRVIAKDVAGRERREAYRALDRDTGINGVGISIEQIRPPIIVPYTEFAQRAGKETEIVTELERSTVGRITVILVSPVLDPGNRRWKFATAQGEFGAAIKDKDFLEKTVRGRTNVPMQGGIEMDIQLETRERLVGGVWQVYERNVVQVDDVRPPPASRQTKLFADDR